MTEREEDPLLDKLDAGRYRFTPLSDTVVASIQTALEEAGTSGEAATTSATAIIVPGLGGVLIPEGHGYDWSARAGDLFADGQVVEVTFRKA